LIVSITESQLRDILLERSAHQPTVPDRANQVRVRIIRRRHRHQLGAVVGGVVAVVLVATAIAVPLDIHDARPTALDSLASAAGIPEYYNGGQLIAARRLDSPQDGAASVSFTPTNWQLTIRVICKTQQSPAAANDPPYITAQMNGHPTAGGTCDFAASGADGQDEQHWSSEGVHLGSASTVTITAGRFSTAVQQSRTPYVLPKALRPTLVATVGIYQRVPVADYRFPKAPKTLVPLAPGGSLATVPILDSRKLGATGEWTLPVIVGSNEEWNVVTVAPGAVKVTVDGHIIELAESWDYQADGQGFNFDPGMLKADGLNVVDGQRVDVVFQATRFTAPTWVVYSNNDADAASPPVAG
jgi:hypothetical protein